MSVTRLVSRFLSLVLLLSLISFTTTNADAATRRRKRQSLSAVCTSTTRVAGNRTVLWKPVPGGIGSDARGLGPLFLAYSQNSVLNYRVRSLTVYNANGTAIAKMGLYPRGTPLVRYYMCGTGYSCLRPSALAARARSTAHSTTIYVAAGKHCYGPIANPAQRIGGK